MSQPSEREREGAEGEASSEHSQKPGDQPGESSATEQKLQAELDEANRERNQFRALLQRTQADYANYQKRMETERAELQKTAGSQVLNKLLPLADDLERALAHAPQDDDVSWLVGMRLIGKKFQAFLQEVGIQVIDPVVGHTFDPWEHEVVSYQPAQGQPDGQIIGVASKGYKLNGRVLRPAQVVVAKNST